MLAFAYFGLPVAVVTCVASVMANLWVQRHLDDPRVARWGADFATAAVFFSVFGGAIETGGLFSVLNPWWFVVPTMAALLGGAKRARLWGSLCMVAIAGMFVAFATGHLTMDPLPHAEGVALAVVTFGSALLANLALITIFARDVRAYRVSLEENIAALEVEVTARSVAEVDALEALAVRARFLAMMSHEIRTPLHGVLGMNQLLEETALTAAQREYVSIALTAGRSLRHIVDEILDHSKLDVGKLSLDPKPFSPNRMATDCCALFASRASEAGIELRCSVSQETPPWMLGDDHRIRQIVMNLVSNAVKFTPEGVVHVSVNGRDGELRISVRDSGVGITAEAIESLFDPFTQADDSTTRRFGGTGLGLSICHDLVALMEGRIDVESEPGQGSTFTIWLPLPQAEAPPVASTEFMDASRPLRILLAEDNPVNQILATRLLENDGHTVLLARNGLEAVEMARTESFELILMDMRMPEMGGLDATRIIRGMGGWLAEVPIVALSASVLDDERTACIDAGMDDFLHKPLDFKVFRRKLAELTHRDRAGHSTDRSNPRCA